MAEAQTAAASSAKKGGLFEHVSELFAAQMSYLSARLRLAGIEGKEAAIHVGIALGLGIGALIAVVFGYLFLVIGLVFVIAAAIGSDHAWIWVTLGAALLHLTGAAACVFVAKSKLSARMFPVTLDELKKDQEWLKTQAKAR